MTAKEAMDLAAVIRPHDYPESVLLRWLTELEGRIAVEIEEREAPEPLTDGQTALGVPAPYDRVYWTYLTAMVDLGAGDAGCYALSSALFREAYDAYARQVRQRGERFGYGREGGGRR